MKINVDLYGGKGFGRETPLEAEEIYCDYCDSCNFYKNGKCLKIRSFLSPCCKFGKTNVIKGYTSRAAKYYDFKKKYTSDPFYHKLEYPNTLVSVMNNHLYINLKFVQVEKGNRERSIRFKQFNDYQISDPSFGTKEVFIPFEDVTSDLLNEIFNYKPHAMFGGIIEDYSKKVVPSILIDLKNVCEQENLDFYKNLIKDYPQYDIVPDYTGREIYIYSLKPGTKIKDNKNQEWTFDGKFLIGNIALSLSNPWWNINDCKCEVKIPINEKMKVKVVDNSIVDENTIFA